MVDTLRDADFQKTVTESALPVLIDFWAPWCGPCLALAPVTDEIAAELSGKLKVYKVNIENDQEIAGQFQVMSIPTLILFVQGQAVEQAVGAQTKDRILKLILPHL